MKIVTVAEMRALEEACERQAGISTDTLMENAGLAVASRARDMAGELRGAMALVLVGPGNNGGDGLVAARHLQEWGARATAYLLLPRKSPDPKLEAALERGVLVERAWDDQALKRLDALMGSARLVIDAVLGTGRARPLDGVMRDAFLKLADARRGPKAPLLLALDLPTGLDADSGAIDPATPTADVTLALGYPKAGHLRLPGAERVGRLEVLDIGIPEALAKDIRRELLTRGWVRERLPRRPLAGHKGTFGRALVVAGSRNYVGAAALAATAAYRAGAGLVTIAAPESIYPILATGVVEATHLPLPETSPGHARADAADSVRELARECQALVVGCGMGQSPETKTFLERLLFGQPALEAPLVLDADGLNNLSQDARWWERLPSNAVLTPHPGEMSRLADMPVPQIQARRWETAKECAERWGQVVVLKGAFTAIASPDGRLAVSPFANPALASGGTGDVLAGIIGGLLAQGLSCFDAACCGVYLHGLAAERVRGETGESGLMAGDLLRWLARVAKDVRGEGNGTPKVL